MKDDITGFINCIVKRSKTRQEESRLTFVDASQYQRRDENTMSFAEHRERLYQSLPENTLVIAYAGVPIHTNEDEYHDFVVNSQYFYLTGLERENTAFLAYRHLHLYASEAVRRPGLSG